MEPLFGKTAYIGDYTVSGYIGSGEDYQSYRVKNPQGELLYLRLLLDNTAGERQRDICCQLQHPNTACYRDSGYVECPVGRLLYLVMEFISGETLAQKMQREFLLSPTLAEKFVLDIARGLEYLHLQPLPILHNNLTMHNVMIDMSKGASTGRIIDFKYACTEAPNKSNAMHPGMNPHYLAPECFRGEFSVRSDIYALGVVFYHLLFGRVPWSVDRDDTEKLLAQKQKSLTLAATDRNQEIRSSFNIIQKALAFRPEDRFASVEEILRALRGEVRISADGTEILQQQASSPEEPPQKAGNGLADVAGMDSLKEQLMSDVINIVRYKNIYEAHKLTLPSGILFYGPPGCGKTFFARKFAEEIGYNFIEITPGTTSDTFKDGSELKLIEQFERARKTAPSVMFFDEIDSLAVSRDKATFSQEYVRKFLLTFISEMDKCDRNKVLIIGATNDIGHLDAAVLRGGRFEYKAYFPIPDAEARRSLLRLYIEDIPHAEQIDYDQLVALTENYTPVDIKGVVNLASKTEIQKYTLTAQESRAASLPAVTMASLLKALEEKKPSLSAADRKRYQQQREEFEQKTTYRPVGFK